MKYHHGSYSATLPSIMSGAMSRRLHSGGKNVPSSTFHLEINSGFPGDFTHSTPTHPFTVVGTTTGQKVLTCDYRSGMERGDILISYSPSTSDQIAASITVGAAPSDDVDQRALFALNVAPPQPSKKSTAGAAARAIVFLLDRSGSMTGQPFEAAQEGLVEGLKLLTPQDTFTVVAYDHEQLYWQDALVPARDNEVREAINWVKNLETRGLTDIMTPLEHAARLLEADAGVGGGGGGGGGGETKEQYTEDGEALGRVVRVPSIFLLTDGAVQNERDIVKWSKMKQQQASGGSSPPRVHSFAVGPWCNHYFLKMLSQSSKGLNDVALTTDSIGPLMTETMQATGRPILTDITLDVEGLKNVEMYPFPIPDLYLGQPILLSGRFQGTWPAMCNISGTDAEGRRISILVPTFGECAIPLKALFVKQRLDLMVANAWYTNSEKDKDACVKLSVQENVPCLFTQVVGFEASPTEIKSFQKEKKLKKGMGTGTKVALIAGGIAAVGLVAFAVYQFGDMGATAAGVSSAFSGAGGAIGNAFSGLTSHCQCCGADCACCDVCGTCGGLGNACGTCCGDVTGWCAGLFDWCGPCWSGLFGGCKDCCGGAGDTCGNCCSGAGEHAGNCWSGCGQCCSGAGDKAGACCSSGVEGAKGCCGNMGETCSGCGGAIKEMASGCGECVSGLFSNLC